MSNAWEKSKIFLKYTSPTLLLLAEGAEKAVNAVNEASDQGIEELQKEITRQELKMQFAKHQARLEQELAISRRIDNADEVEIEEFYDGVAKAGFEIGVTNETASAGLSGKYQKITKRIYRFKGWRDIEETSTFVVEEE